MRYIPSAQIFGDSPFFFSMQSEGDDFLENLDLGRRKYMEKYAEEPSSVIISPMLLATLLEELGTKLNEVHVHALCSGQIYVFGMRIFVGRLLRDKEFCFTIPGVGIC